MTLLRSFIATGLFCLSTAPALAVDFSVNTVFDGSLDHDVNPGDGICASSRGGLCGLRTAIEEANARAGTDRIFFSVSGVIAPSTEGALPTISDHLVILGDSAPGYDIEATDIGDAPPAIFIDGVFLSTASADGLRFGSGAANSTVIALGIVAMPDDGIAVTGTADGLLLDRCWIGTRADGSAAGNGGDGVELATADNFIGKRQLVDEVTGLGNLISSNGANGIRVTLAGTGGNRIAGNRIGLTASGLGARGNGGYGIISEIGDNDIGRVILGEAVGNLIAANASGGIHLFAGNGNRVTANILGFNRNGASVSSPGSGIHALGSDHLIGGDLPVAGNRVANHVNGIRVGFGVLQGNSVRVRNNRIGSNTLSQGVSDFGIWIDEGSLNEVLENDVIFAGQVGIAVGADGTIIQGNRVGFCPSIFGVEDCSNAVHGISVIGDDNVIGNGFSAALVPDAANVIGFSTVHGVLLQGSRNIVAGNFIGITQDGEVIANGDDGMRLGGPSLRPIDNFVRLNRVENNGGSGIALVGDNTTLRNAIEFNRLVANAGPGVDLGDDGVDINDFGDADESINRRMNYPDIASVTWSTAGGQPHIDVEYSVSTSASAAAFPLFVDFFVGSGGLRDAGSHLGSGTYSIPGDVRVQRVNLPAGTRGGFVVAQVIDAAGNSSELSAAFPFGDLDALFFDGFESLP